MARQVLEGVLAGEGTPTEVADARGLELVQDDSALEALLLDAAREGARDMDALAGAVLALAARSGAARDDMTAVCLRIGSRE
jgi:aspartyl-tRNA(Asn)/glutamyl-tRNA(Gln) amidotransferase subunit B